MKVAFVTPELQSLVHRTNLAGVAESLSQALREAGADVRVILPWTSDVRLDSLGELQDRGTVSVQFGRRKRRFEVAEGDLAGLPVVLLSNEELFGSRHPYGDHEGPYPDNWLRYACFARAVLESIALLDWEPDVIHCMDWTTGLIPIYHRLEFVRKRPEHPVTRAGTWFAVHNLAMQGTFEREILPRIGIPHEYFRSIEGVELGGKVSFLKAGAEFATIIGTHSPNHALNIQEQDRGYGLEETFQRRKKELVGITNGIDYHAWDPSNDPALAANYSATDKELNGKRKCKAALQQALKLDSGPRTPIACTIGRWDADSGFDLLAEILTQVLERGVELVAMGSGLPEIHQRLKTMESTFMGRCAVVEGYQPAVAHMIMGGADLLLLPSHYQPSNPLFAIAMRYGVVPIVYAKSGLEDTVVDVRAHARRGTGFHFEPYSSEGLMQAIDAAIKTYKSAASWKLIARRCLRQDFSWRATAAEYLKAYRRVTRRTRARRRAG